MQFTVKSGTISSDYSGSSQMEAVKTQNSIVEDRRGSSLLKILPEEMPLRVKSPLLDSVRWPDDPLLDPPRALRGLAHIVDGGLCHRCGSCIGICPTKVLSSDEDGYPIVKNLSSCTDCDLCVRVCPGDEFDFHKYHDEQFETPGDLTKNHGVFIEAIIAHATEAEIRQRSTSGGLTTAILLDLLERKEIDGAVVIIADEETLWKGKPIIARNREQIVRAMKSKYAIAPTNSVFSEILTLPGRYALVGLPCQIHGFIKACELDKRLKERVVLTIGLFCHAAIEPEAYKIIWETLGAKGREAQRFISRVGKHPGAPHIELKDGSLYPVYFGHKKGYRPTSMEVINLLYRIYSPDRCLTCFDGAAEFADISVGDPWMAPPESDVDFKQGWSAAYIRTSRGKDAIEKALTNSKIVTRLLTMNEAINCNKMMTTEKRWRAFRIIETQRRQGKSIPAYGPHGFEMPKHSGTNFIKTEINMLTHSLCFMPRARARALRFVLGNGGYCLLWLNHKRRVVREFLRDKLAALKRSIFGRS